MVLSIHFCVKSVKSYFAHLSNVKIRNKFQNLIFSLKQRQQLKIQSREALRKIIRRSPKLLHKSRDAKSVFLSLKLVFRSSQQCQCTHLLSSFANSSQVVDLLKLGRIESYWIHSNDEKNV